MSAQLMTSSLRVETSKNNEKFIERTFWTSSTFVFANTLATIFFSEQSFTSRMIFSIIQGATFVFLFESKAVEKKMEELKNSLNHVGVHRVIDYAFFFFLGVMPIITAVNITTWTFQPLSLKQGVRIGLFNYVASTAGMVIYDKIFISRLSKCKE